MGNVMLSLDEETEALLRNLASRHNGGKKGSLSAIATEAIHLLEERKNESSKEQFFQKIRKGENLKYRMYKSRAELYD